jgi:exonuclease SbcD
LDPARPSILLGHISIDAAEAGAERGIMAGRDITIPLSAIPEAFTFAVFGHIHKAQDFGHLGRSNVLYTGSTERIDAGEESEQKSYIILDLDTATWERVEIPCRRYCTIHVASSDDTVFDFDTDLQMAEDAICRVAIERAENERPDYQRLQTLVEQAGCWDFRGFVEDVSRSAAVRSADIVQAQSLEELLGVWHAAKGCEIPLEDLVAAGSELERSVAR